MGGGRLTVMSVLDQIIRGQGGRGGGRLTMMSVLDQIIRGQGGRGGGGADYDAFLSCIRSLGDRSESAVGRKDYYK